MRRTAQLAVAILCASGCSRREGSTGAERKWLGGVRAIEFREPVPLGHYLGPGHVHGAGKLSDGGAVTFDDGVLWVTRDAQTRRVEAGTPYDGVAIELTIAQVSDWFAVTLAGRTTFTGAVDRARSEAVQRGFAETARVPMRIEGVPSSRQVRIAPSLGPIAADAVVIIGFLDGPFHAVLASPPITGELVGLDDVELEAGARVLIPSSALFP